MTKINVNIISGALGSGKTTLIRHLLAHKPTHEHWTVLVNEFGAVGIDGAILETQTDTLVKQMPGGCICCTSKAELKSAIAELRQTQTHRLIIEPTGLGEPDTLVDLFKEPEFINHFEVQTLFSVFDIANTSIEELKSLSIMQSLLNMADVLILNKQDLAQSTQTQALINYCQTLYPPKQAILVTQNGAVETDYLTLTHQFISAFQPLKNSENPRILSPHATTTHTPAETDLPYHPIDLPHLLDRRYKKQLGVQSMGWIFSDEATFDWLSLRNLFESLQKRPDLVERAKGVFKVGHPWMLFQYTHTQVSREYIAYRKDSRLELLIPATYDFDFIDFENQLKRCLKTV